MLVPAAPVVRRLEPSRAAQAQPPHRHRSPPASSSSAAPPAWPPPPRARCRATRCTRSSAASSRPASRCTSSDAGKGDALLDQARHPPRRGQGAAGAGLARRRPDRLHARRRSAAAADAGSDKLFTAYQADGDTSDISTVRDFTATRWPRWPPCPTRRYRSTSDQLVDTADLLADIDQQARVLCAACAPQAPLQPPAALSSGAGAASVDNLLARPVSQVRADVARAQAARIARLQAAAERSAQAVAQVERREQGRGRRSGTGH